MSNTKKIYLAGRFAWKEMYQAVADKLEYNGFKTTSTWVRGGEQGLTRADIALLDCGDIDEADTFLAFTEPRGSWNTSGGRHVEFGYALAKGKRVCIIGETENVFYAHPAVEVFKTLDEFIES